MADGQEDEIKSGDCTEVRDGDVQQVTVRAETEYARVGMENLEVGEANEDTECKYGCNGPEMAGKDSSSKIEVEANVAGEHHYDAVHHQHAPVG